MLVNEQSNRYGRPFYRAGVVDETSLSAQTKVTTKAKLLAAVLFVGVGALLVPDVTAESVYTPYAFTTLAGNSAYGSRDGTNSDTRFWFPGGVALDAVGSVYVADSLNNTIRKLMAVGTNWVTSTIAGLPLNPGSADGTNGDARFNNPLFLTADAAGSLYVADTGNCTIRKLTQVGTNWITSTIAGQAGSQGNADGTNSDARFHNPSGVAVDSGGNLYVSDGVNRTIRKLTPVGTNWVTSTIAGLAGVLGSVDGTNSDARFESVGGLAVDSGGNIYVADFLTIRKIAPVGTNWVTSTIAGLAGRWGSADGTNSDARFLFPFGVAVDRNGNAYVTDTGNFTIRKLTPVGTNWVTSTIAGVAKKWGSADGTNSAARFSTPEGVAVDGSGNLYLTDGGNNTIRTLTSAGTNWVSGTIAGLVGGAGSADGTNSAARFSSPTGVAVDSGGNVYVADYGNYTIRKVTPNGVVTTLAGLAGSPGSADGPVNTARFGRPLVNADGQPIDWGGPAAVALDAAGNIWVSDSGNATIRQITPDGVVSTVAGLAGSYGNVDGTGNAARFGYSAQGDSQGPLGITTDGSGNVYVADAFAQTIRKVTPAGMVTTLAGLAYNSGTVDGMGNEARFSRPSGVVSDGAGNLYVADMLSNTIRRVTLDGLVTTIAGSDTPLLWPYSTAVDFAGNVYVTDSANLCIRKLAPSGTNWVFSTVAGLPGNIYLGNGVYSAAGRGSADGVGNAVRFTLPQGIAVDKIGNLYVVDRDNNTLQKGVPTVYFASPVSQVSEDSGFASLAVTLAGPYGNPVSVNCATSDGTASAGLDYVATNGTILFSPGQTSATFNVPVLNDSLVEEPRTVIVTLSGPTGGVPLGTPVTAVLTIMKNDFFTMDSPSDVNENDGAVAVTVERHGATQIPLTVAYFTSDGPPPGCSGCPRSAIAGVDYVSTEGTFTFEVGQTNKTFTIPILDNSRVDGDRVFTITASYGSNWVSEGQITIHDNEVPVNAVDYSFNPGAGVSGGDLGIVYSVALQTDGKILIGGDFTAVEGVARNRVARLNPNGSLDGSFDPGMGVNGTNAVIVNSVVVQADGKILIGGWFSTVNGIERQLVARLNGDGSVDQGFQPGAIGNYQYGTSPDPFVYHLTLQGDGRILIGGGFSSVSNISRSGIARLNPDGSLDASLDPGTGVDGHVRSVVVQPDGKLLIGGQFTTFNGVSRNGIARLNVDGSLDNSFNPGTGLDGGIAAAMALQADGKLLVGGFFSSVNGTNRTHLMRLNADGSLESLYNPEIEGGGLPVVLSLYEQADGKLVVAGQFYEINGSSRNGIARLNSDGTLDTDLDPGTGISGGAFTVAFAVTEQADHNILIGGGFGSVNNVERKGIARLYGNTANLHFVQFATPTYQAMEDGVGAILVQRAGESSTPITVDYATRDDTARAGINYTATNGTLAFAPLETTKTISIPMLDDHLLEGDLAFRVTLSNPTGGALLGLSTATVIIRNVDFGFPPGSVTVLDNGLINLSLNAPSSAHFVVEASTNFVDWIPLGTNEFNLTDSQAPLFMQRFYRARMVGP
jgi:uncharacterized delta-60 repeat protein